jgi:hypothetical protein
LFGRGEALISSFDHHLSLLNHVHELNPNQRSLGGRKRFEAEHRTGDPLHAAVILFHHIIQIFHLPNDDVGPMRLIVASDRGFIGLTAVNSNRLGDPMAADRLCQKPKRRLGIPVLREEKVDGLPCAPQK